MKKPTEQQLVRQVLDYLALKRVFAWRQNQGAARYPKRGGGEYFVRATSLQGISDVIGVLPDGRFLAVECKTDGGRLRPTQEAFLDLVRTHGGVALVVRSLAELRAALDPILDATEA